MNERASRREAGFALADVLIAVAILATVLAVTAAGYDRRDAEAFAARSSVRSMLLAARALAVANAASNGSRSGATLAFGDAAGGSLLTLYSGRPALEGGALARDGHTPAVRLRIRVRAIMPPLERAFSVIVSSALEARVVPNFDPAAGMPYRGSVPCPYGALALALAGSREAPVSLYCHGARVDGD